jgi:broad specificity phosphatase PhoE
VPGTAGDFDAALPEGESANQLAARVSRFLDWLRTREEEHILVCSHGRTLRCMVTLMKQQPLQHMEYVRHANTGCFKVQRREAFFHFEFENDTRHLHHAQKEL